MLFNQINPFVRKALVGNLNRSDTYDVYTKIKSADCRLFYMISGEGYINIEGVRYLILPGTTVMFSSGTEYIWETDRVKYCSINFDYTHNFSYIKDSIHPIHSDVLDDKIIVEKVHFSDVLILNEPIILHDAPSVGRLMMEITTEFSLSGDYKDMLLSSLLKSAITSVLRTYLRQSNVKESRAQKLICDVVSYINLNYNRPITNEDIAAKFHFNSAYLNRVFQKNTGSTIHEFLLNCRIAAAKEMLRSQFVSISEVAEKCGFCDLHHFSKIFKLKTEMTPSEYRKYTR